MPEVRIPEIPAPVVHVTIEKGGQVRKEMEIKTPDGEVYKGIVTHEED